MMTGVAQHRYPVADWIQEEMMGRQGMRLTDQEERFVQLVVLERKSYAAAFRLAYPPKRKTERSSEGERVGGKKIARRRLVRERMEELAAECKATDPEELRRAATGVLTRILAGRLDPAYRLTAIATLRYLDAQERAKARADQEALRTMTAQLAVVDAIENGERARSTVAKPQEKEPPQVELDDIINEIAELVQEQRLERDPEHPAMPLLETQSDDPLQATGEAIPPEAKDAVDQDTPPPQRGSRLVRRAGFFGRGSWVRLPSQG